MANLDSSVENNNHEGHHITLTKTQFKLQGLVMIPPQPIWFPDTDSLQPQSDGRKEAVRFCNAVKDGAVVGYVAIKEGVNETMDFVAFSREKLINYIMDPSSIPKEEGCIVQLHQGVVLPFNLPDISDLSLHPRVARIYMEWLLEWGRYEHLNTIMTTLLQETATEMPTRRETWYTQGGSSKVAIRSFGNYFKDVRVNAAYANLIKIETTYFYTTTDPRDGRTMELQMEACRHESTNLKRRRILDSVVRNMMIWNCRGVGSCGFLTALDLMVDCHRPELILLLETRVNSSVIIKIANEMGFKLVACADPIGAAGGVALLSIRGSSHVFKETIGMGKWACLIELR